jgi:putative flippase GtrA
MTQKYFKYIKYAVSGCAAAFVNVALLYALTEYGHIYYLLSAVMGFLLGFTISFTLQKFWTFQNTERANIHRQSFLYFLVSLFSLGLNTFLVYVLVEFVHTWYIVAALFSGLCIAFINFSIYQSFIFVEISHGNK